MGNPSIYYTRALQNLSHALAYDDEKYKLAKELREETDDKQLEAFIEQKKAELPEKDFYFLAGRATQCVFDDVSCYEGCDALNASCCGLASFQRFIGLSIDDDEDSED